MTLRRSLWLSLVCCGLLAAGCATAPPTGRIGGTTVPVGAAVALVSTPFYPLDAFDPQGSFLDQLRGYGLAPTSSADAPFVVQIHFTAGDEGAIDCRLVLLKGKEPILSAEGSSRHGPKNDAELPTEADRRTAFRQSAFREAARNFAAKARTSG